MPESPGDADTDPGRRENTLESCEIAFGRRVFTCRRPSEAPRAPQEARGCPRRPPRKSQDADSYVFSRAGEAPGRRSTLVFTCRRGPRRAQEADPYVFLRIFLESGRGPRRPEDAPGWPPDTCFYVFSLRATEAPGGPMMPQDGPQIRVFTCDP